MDATYYTVELERLNAWGRDIRRVTTKRSPSTIDASLANDAAISFRQWLSQRDQSPIAYTADLVSPVMTGTPPPGWRERALDLTINSFTESTQLQVNNGDVDSWFRSYETVALTTFGFGYSLATRMAASLPSFAKARRWARTADTGLIGNGVTNLFRGLYQRLSNDSMAMVLPLSEVLSLINRSTKALHLAAMIDADGQVLTVLEPVLGHQVANPLCRLSQLLADLKGFYDAAHL